MGEDAAHRRSIETQRDLHQRPRRGGKLQPVACRASHRPYTVHQPSDAQLHSLLTQHLRLLLLDPQFICGCSHRRHQTGVVDLFTHATQPRRETLTRVALCSCSSARTTNSACGPNTHTHTHTHTLADPHHSSQALRQHTQPHCRCAITSPMSSRCRSASAAPATSPSPMARSSTSSYSTLASETRTTATKKRKPRRRLPPGALISSFVR